MSWSPPQCPECSSFSTRFERVMPFGPPDLYGLYWECESCRSRVLELCPTGVDDPRPGGCLNCGAAVDASGRCPDCGVERPQLLERVHAHCGSPPQLDAVEALIDQGLFRLAFNTVDLCLEQRPDDPPVLALKAKLLLEVQRPERAVPLLRRALDRGLDEPSARINFGIALSRSGRQQEAIRVYQDHLACETEPSCRAILLSNIGGCLSALGHTKQAEAYHRRAIEADPEHLGPRWNLFANLFGSQQYEGALEVVEQTMALSFLEPDERENLQAYRSEVLISLRRYQDALAAIDASLASDPCELNRLGTRARILIHLDAVEAARACIAQILSLDPKHKIALHLLERLDRRAGPGARN
ncbi:MAG: tetratricopeptide repeat protein [Enhygromyxa sp.]